MQVSRLTLSRMDKDSVAGVNFTLKACSGTIVAVPSPSAIELRLQHVRLLHLPQDRLFENLEVVGLSAMESFRCVGGIKLRLEMSRPGKVSAH